MASIFASEEEFARLRTRYEAWRDQGFPEIDAGIQPLLERLNAVDGVVTVSSCVGHHLQAKQLKYPFFIYFACRDEKALAYVRSLYALLGVRLREALAAYEDDRRSLRTPRPSHVMIHYENLSLVTGFKDLTMDNGEILTYCRHALVAKGTHTGFHRENFLKEVLEAVDKLPQES